MIKINVRKLSSFLILSVMFLNTCAASTDQPMPVTTMDTTVIPETQIATEPVAEGTQDTSIEATAVITPTAYLPLINRAVWKFSGIYFNQYWTEESVAAVMLAADAGVGKKHTSVGWFIDLEDTAFTEPIPPLMGNNLYSQLEWLWLSGYTSFVNLGTNATAGQIINGERDSQIGYAAQLYKTWVDQGGGRRAMIAPMQEMNGEWTAYGQASTSDEFKIAYQHILDVFATKGVTRDQVWWVFAPNGYNDPAQPQRAFEYYYPGDGIVDIVGFSAYNYGYCPAIPESYRRWESYPQIFEPYIARMVVMAPDKPIIIAETASTAYYTHDDSGVPIFDYNVKSQWLKENYDYFANRAGVIGIFYFSFSQFDGYNCDLEIDPNGVVLGGYMDGLSDPTYKYLNILELDILIK